MENTEDKKEVQVEATELPESEKKLEQKFKKLNKKTIIILVIVIVLGVLFYLSRGFFIAATVNGQPISRWSVLSTLEKESGKDLLESLILEKLIASEIRDRQLDVSDEELDTEIKKIEEQVIAQGGTFAEALAQEGMTLDILKKQILLQKQVEKLLADKVAVTDEELDQYITDSQTVIPVGQELAVRDQLKGQLVNQKLNKEAPSYIEDLKAKAQIKYFVNY